MEGHIYLQFQPGAGKIRSNSLSMCQTLGHFLWTLSWGVLGFSKLISKLSIRFFYKQIVRYQHMPDALF